MKLLRILLPALVLATAFGAAPAFADDDWREREKKFAEWAREDAKRHDEWLRESRKRHDEDRREARKAEAEYWRERGKAEREYAREARKHADEYWRERDKDDAEAYREWLEDRRDQRQYRDAWEVVDYIGRVTIGELIHESRRDDD